MENLAQILRGLAPGQIEEAVELLQRYKTEHQEQGQAQQIRQVQTPQQLQDPQKSDEKGNSNAVDATVTNTDAAAKAASAAITIAMHHIPTVSTTATTGREAEEENEANCNNCATNEESNEEDIPLALLYASRRRSQKEQEQTKDKEQEPVSTSSTKDLASTRQTASRRGENKTENNSSPNKNGGTSSVAEAAPAPTAPRGLASFGFVSSTRRSGGSVCDKNRLITAFVQDKRIVPRALRFWDAPETPPPSPPLPPPPALPPFSSCHGAPAVAVDESSSSLLHPPVVCAVGDGEGEGDVQHVPDKVRYASFAEMIDAATTAAQTKSSEAVTDRGCSCPFHVRLPAPRTGFCDEVIFCGFYAIGYDPCQSRPPYFGTHNSQEALNSAELLRLARFPLGAAMPRLSTLDYDYDSGDDWDVVDGDEDIGASSSGEDDEEDDAGSSLGESELDFINDGAAGEEGEDEDAELQRKMMEARQRRVNRLRHKEKLVPAFSGPFVGVALVDHPLRAFDRLDRLTPALAGGPALTAVLEPELIAINRAATETDECEDEEQQQRFVEAALRCRREMTPGELDAVHALVAANARLTPRAIVDTLQEQHWCAGVARAEILRTIRRYYESQHKRLVRRPEPWAATDERLFTKPTRRPTAAKGTGALVEERGQEEAEANGNGERVRSGEDNEEEEEEKDEDDEDEEGCGSGDETLVMHLLRKRQRETEEATGTSATTVANE